MNGVWTNSQLILHEYEYSVIHMVFQKISNMFLFLADSLTFYFGERCIGLSLHEITIKNHIRMVITKAYHQAKEESKFKLSRLADDY